MKKQFFKTTRAKREKYIKAVKWLKENYTPEEIAGVDMIEMIRPFCDKTGIHFGLDDIGIVFLVAEGKARI